MESDNAFIKQPRAFDRPNQRLIDMTRDFIEITKDFELEELYCLQTIKSVFQGLPEKKAKRMLRIIGQITQKY